ncbi:hypothetical protein ACFQT0_25630 [Hymenobacter humi]|uniref:Uncharacterized protein n=1 Tax=Hymenobacter humi TaxID=1411620 RepID=A0ABW2UA21_9BACT
MESLPVAGCLYFKAFAVDFLGSSPIYQRIGALSRRGEAGQGYGQRNLAVAQGEGGGQGAGNSVPDDDVADVVEGASE